MEIRRLLADDAELFQTVRLRALTEEPRAFLSSHAEESAYSTELVAGRLEGEGDNFTLGAFSGGALVGLVGFYRQPKEKSRHNGLLWGMYVSRAHRRSGIGGALIDALLERARALDGLATVHLAVDESNAPARTLYESLGFVGWGVEPDAFRVHGKPVDELHMRLAL